MKTEIITSQNVAEAQEQINKFLLNNPINVVSVEVRPYNLHDLFYDGNVCNQWIEYITTILYK
jgi:hypothetical protein